MVNKSSKIGPEITGEQSFELYKIAHKVIDAWNNGKMEDWATAIEMRRVLDSIDKTKCCRVNLPSYMQTGLGNDD